MYFYWAYGLRVKSELEFPELFPLEVDSEVDVEILLGEEGISFTELDISKPYSYFIQQSDFKMNVYGVAVYHVISGSSIIVFPFSGACVSDIRVYCLSNAFAAILHQQKKIPLHAGAIHCDDQLILVMGDSGAGKTTLLFNLLQKGYRIFSDDVVVLSEDRNGSVNCISSYPVMKIWKSQAERIGMVSGIPIRKGVEKYPLYFHDKFDCRSLSPMIIVVLKISSSINDIECKEFQGADTVMELLHHIYRREYLSHYEIFSILPLLSRLANQCKFIEITRPAYLNKEHQLMEFFIKKIGG